MKFLNLHQVLALHVLTIEQFGGSNGLRDLAPLESAVASQQQEVFGKELFESVFDKSAAVCRSIIAGHPFVDGNKRTAMLAALTLLRINGFEFVATKGELEDFAVGIAVEHLDVSDIAAWFEAHSRSI